MKFDNKNCYLVDNFMYQFVKGMLPEVFSDSFTRIVDMHDHYTRVSKGLSVSFERTNYRRFSIYCSGPKIWNALPIKIKYPVCTYILTIQKALERPSYSKGT